EHLQAHADAQQRTALFVAGADEVDAADVVESGHHGGEGPDAGDEESVGVVDDIVVGRQRHLGAGGGDRTHSRADVAGSVVEDRDRRHRFAPLLSTDQIRHREKPRTMTPKPATTQASVLPPRPTEMTKAGRRSARTWAMIHSGAVRPTTVRTGVMVAALACSFVIESVRMLPSTFSDDTVSSRSCSSTSGRFFNARPAGTSD